MPVALELWGCNNEAAPTIDSLLGPFWLPGSLAHSHPTLFQEYKSRSATASGENEKLQCVTGVIGREEAPFVENPFIVQVQPKSETHNSNP